MSDLALFDLEDFGLRLEPTQAMLEGWQRVVQHSWCGTIVVWDSKRHGEIGRCPACDRPDSSWWEQKIGRDGLAGLRLLDPETGVSEEER